MLTSLAALALGAVSTVLALRVRRNLVATLGPGYAGRFVAVQAGLINLVLWYVVMGVAGWLGLQGDAVAVGLPLAYGALFFGYSLQNIDWTARKFHDVEA